MKALIDQYSYEELSEMVKQSSSFNELLRVLGYHARSGGTRALVRERLSKLQISTEHFNNLPKNCTQRNPENIFIENSTAHQSTLRLWYKRGGYTPYVCSICGQEPFWNGKELTLILDHINGHNKDDRLENLRWVCPNCNQQLDTTNGKNKYPLKKANYCIDCGKELVSKTAKRCQSCASKQHSYRNEQGELAVQQITREELKAKIRYTPFTTIAAEYGVSDKAVSKWCLKYGLPSRKKEIKQYTNEEWEKL